MNPKKGLRLQKSVYFVLRILAGWAIKLFTRFSCEHYKPKAKTFLLVGNHTIDLDPLYVILTIRRHARFVASANIMRGFPGCLVRWLAGPIPRYKGAPADDVSRAIKENLKAGVSVVTFPEGNTTWDGETGYISKKVAVLAKESGVSLITYNACGGYLKKPRWAKYSRRGRVFGRVVGEYSAEALSAMSTDEVWDLIKKDLYVDAYEQQRISGNTYKGRRRAEGLEGPLYVCPSCGCIGSLKSFDNGFYCDCGLNFFLNEEGMLENIEGAKSASSLPKGFVPAKLPGTNYIEMELKPPEGGNSLRRGFFAEDEAAELKALASKERISILEWSKAQKKYLKASAKALKDMTDEPIFTDTCTRLSVNDGTKRTVISENPQILFFGDRMEIGGNSFALSDISSMAVFRGFRIFFTCGKSYYEAEFPESAASQKYPALWRICTDRPYL